jgi:hypothetical protein
MARIRVEGGLGNRLQALLSCRSVFGELEVVWDPTDDVSHAVWSDVFESLKGVTDATGFVENGSWWSVHPDAKPGWEKQYAELMPTTEVMARIFQYKPAREYLAVHIRRTDYVGNVAAHNNMFPPLEHYLDWADNWPGLLIYLATDNGETQRKMMRDPRVLVGATLGGVEEQHYQVRTRQGTAQDAVADMFVCARAKHFLGSPGSSFTETIKRLRDCR